jgi:hypothetical protein
MFTWFKFQRKRWFWYIRHYILSSKFYINRFFFSTTERRERIEEDFSIASSLFRGVISSIVLSLFFVLFFGLVDYVLERFFFTRFNIIAVPIISKLLFYVSPDNTSYVTLFSVIASIAGVFLGLYFTAISGVVSVYAKFPDNIRNLLLREKVGNFYIRLLSLTTILSVFLIGYKVFWNNPGIILSLAVLLLGCFSFFCFTLLGVRAFFFFDPSSFGDVLFQDLRKYIKLATVNGYKFADQSFQAHYQKIASEKLRTLKVLIDICVKERHLQETSLLLVLIKTMFLLGYYEDEKACIPSDSRWFNRTPVHKDWFLTDSSTLMLAIQTHSFIQPEMVPNSYWFEDRVWEMILYSVDKMIADGNVELVSDFLNRIYNYFEKMGYDLELKKCEDVLCKLNPIIIKYLSANRSSEETYTDDQLSVLEVWSVARMSAPLGFYRFCRELNVKSIVADIGRIGWRDKTDLYKHKIPSAILPRLEYLQDRLRIENAIEGRTISPDWYKQQLVICRYFDLSKECIDILLDSLDKFFIFESEAFIKNKLFLLAALLSKRGLETCSKIMANIPHLERSLSELDKIALVIKEIPCQKIDWKAMRSRVDKAQNKLVEIQAKCLPALSLLKKQKTRPDVFGQTYNTVCQEAYYALAENKKDIFVSLFPVLFVGALMAFENLKEDLKDREVEVLISIASEPLLDILNLSGYAKIYSELYEQKEIWNTCVSVWNNYFKDRQDKKDLLKRFIVLQEFRKGQFKIFPRDYLRTNWETMLGAKLQEKNIIDDRLGFSSHPWGEKNIDHKSPFIRALCRGRYLHHVSAPDVFILTYLLKQPEAQGIEFKDYSQLNEAIEREVQENNQEKDNETV